MKPPVVGMTISSRRQDAFQTMKFRRECFPPSQCSTSQWNTPAQRDGYRAAGE